MKQVCLLTGRPGTGKTSIIKQLAAELEGKAGGFYTEEIRSQGGRIGFRLITLDGKEATLAHTGFARRYCVGKYGVDIGSLEGVGVSALRRAAGQNGLVIVDEIGKMELFSTEFRRAVEDIIDSGKKVLGTVMLAPHPWADSVKGREQVELITVTRDNRSSVLSGLRHWLKDV
jgi:nucleoside-triphosphatase